MLAFDLRWVSGSDSCMCELSDFRWRILYEPVGVENRFDWCDDGPGVRHLIAAVDEEIVGYGRLEGGGREAQIRHLCVDPRYRRRGVGTALLDALVNRARLEGAETVFLNARFTALTLYRSRGFFEVGPIFHTEHTHLPHKRMELRV